MEPARRTVRFDESAIDAIFRDLDSPHLPGAVVGVAIEGRPVYRRGFGLASMEFPIGLSPSTRLRICSATKHFAALAYLLLCEQGLASLDDPIGRFLPELHRVSRGVSVRQLMGNTSGLRDVHGICWQLSGMGVRVSSQELLRLYRTMDDVNFAPGTSYCYNNGGFLLLSAAIERIADLSLEEVFRTRIFEPIGMTDSLLCRSDATVVVNRATPHMVGSKGEYFRYAVGTEVAGEGGIVSTIDDMLRWLQHMDAPQIGSRKSWRLLQLSQQLRNGTATGYGLGLATGCYRGVATLSHPGGWMGINVQMIKVPAACLDVVVIVNRHDVASAVLANRIVDACIPDLQSEVEVHTPSIAAGVFRSRRTGRVIELKARDGQQIVSIDGMDIVTLPGPDEALQPSGLMAFMKQSFLPLGSPTRPLGVRMIDYGNVEELEALTGSTGTDATICGRYRSPSTASELVISDVDGTLQARANGPFGSVAYELQPVAARTYRLCSEVNAPQWGGTLSVTDDLQEIHLSSWSNWAMPFRRAS